ncbi:MAG: cyclase family protein [Streptosporangiaceae bacterium]
MTTRSERDTGALLTELRAARTYDLEQPRRVGSPTFPAHFPGYVYGLHRRHEAGLAEARTSASGLITMAEHSGTHIDALCHQAENLAMYGGRTVDASVQTSQGFTELGAEDIPLVMARGVLLDVAASRGQARLGRRELVSADDLAAAERAQGVSVQRGDVVLVRTGNGQLWDDPDTYLDGPGLDRGAAEWLAERAPLAVGADNVAVDLPGHRDPDLGTLPGHVVLIVRNGIYIIENVALEELARDRVHEFVFMCVALKLMGATGSPVRPLAFV